MSVYKSINGMVELSITSADPALTLMQISKLGITVYDSRIEEDLITLRFCLNRQDVNVVKKMANRKGYECKITGRSGIHWHFRSLFHRPILVFGLVLLLMLSFYLPSRVLFVRVEGNVQVPTRLILEKCAENGISFGASRRQVRSEKVKNGLISDLPELQWVGVNTHGCVAIVTVRERPQTAPLVQEKKVSSIVAVMDGLVLSCTATSGTLQCKVGQQVFAGQTLISGITDCGICIRATSAKGEIQAQTKRSLTVFTLLEGEKIIENTAIEEKYALIIGKIRINFYKGSGISGTTCDKIYEENYMTLPGGFQLPVAIVKETWIYAETQTDLLEQETALHLLENFAAWYLPTQMVAGSILDADPSVSFQDGYAVLQGDYTCCEMIGQVKIEEIIAPYGNDQ